MILFIWYLFDSPCDDPLVFISLISHPLIKMVVFFFFSFPQTFVCFDARSLDVKWHNFHNVFLFFFSFRVAVIHVPYSSFCFGTSRPRGLLAVKIRHLRILGYTPVLVRKYIVVNQELMKNTQLEKDRICSFIGLKLHKKAVFSSIRPVGVAGFSSLNPDICVHL